MMMLGRRAEELAKIVAHIIETRREQIVISPTWVATEAMAKMEAVDLQKSMPLIYEGCHLYLRQVARSLLRKKFDPDDGSDSDQHPLFPDLQPRYPVQRPKGDEPEYIKLENLSRSDATYNIERLRAEAHAKLRHADALQSWLSNRYRDRA